MNREKFTEVSQWLNSQIVGQSKLIDRLLTTLICGGHLLVEGAPGLAKTRAIKELANVVSGEFHRIQFTPDLLPSDVTGTEIYRPETGAFEFQQGPIFNNLVLADEVNRAPAKVQSALLEAMGEQQVSIGRETYSLPKLFMVMATQNPIEQEGTYPLPEAQLDRFLMHIEVLYPDAEAEARILHLVRSENANQPKQPPMRPLTEEEIFSARKETLELHMAPSVEEYIIALVMATRNPPEKLKPWLSYGASPRATIALDQCARTVAWLAGKDFVSPDDVQEVAHDVLRHRLIVSFEALAEDVSANTIVSDLLDWVPVP